MSFDGSTIPAATTGTFVSGVYTDTFNITTTIDVDMVALELVAGVGYQIDVDNGVSGDLHLRIFDEFGNEVKANDDGFRTVDDTVFSVSPFVEFCPSYSGTYYISISPYYLQDYDPTTTLGRASPENPISSTSGTLTVTAFDPNLWASSASINAISAESGSDETDMMRDEDGSLRVAYTGAIDSAADVDIARMDLSKSDVIVVDVNGLEGNGTVLRVFNSAGTQIGFDDDAGFGEDPELVFNAPSTGSFYVGISGEGNSTYNGLDGTGTVNGTIGSFEVIVHRNPTQIGTSSVNNFSGGEDNNYIVSLAGNDTVNGNDGADTLAGGDDSDSLTGGNGSDVLYGEQGNDQLFGGNSNDVLTGGLGNDTLDGVNGIDLLEGGDGDDSVLGGAGTFNDTLSGDAGNDTLNGGAGDDSMNGGVGNDSMLGGAGNDQMNGGSDNDTLLASTGNDLAFGEAGNDRLEGVAGLDTLDGGTGNDSLFGGASNDVLLGGADNDSLSGGSDADILTGGIGTDTLNGGPGADTFQFLTTADGFDLIQDFVLDSDLIDLAAIFAGQTVDAGNLAQFIQVTPSGGGADSFLAVDANGATGGLSFTIIAQVNGVTTGQLFDIDNFLL